MDHNHLWAYKLSSKEIVSIFFLITDGMFWWIIWMLFSQFSINPLVNSLTISKIRLINYLVDFPPCMLIFLIDIFNINIHGPKICSCLMYAFIISISRNRRSRMSTRFIIPIFSITADFFRKISSESNGLFNFIILPICRFL